MDFGKFAFGNSTISICFWVVTCLYLAMRNILQSVCTYGMFLDRYAFIAVEYGYILSFFTPIDKLCFYRLLH